MLTQGYQCVKIFKKSFNFKYLDYSESAFCQIYEPQSDEKSEFLNVCRNLVHFHRLSTASTLQWSYYGWSQAQKRRTKQTHITLHSNKPIRNGNSQKRQRQVDAFPRIEEQTIVFWSFLIWLHSASQKKYGCF